MTSSALPMPACPVSTSPGWQLVTLSDPSPHPLPFSDPLCIKYFEAPRAILVSWWHYVTLPRWATLTDPILNGPEMQNCEFCFAADRECGSGCWMGCGYWDLGDPSPHRVTQHCTTSHFTVSHSTPHGTNRVTLHSITLYSVTSHSVILYSVASSQCREDPTYRVTLFHIA